MNLWDIGNALDDIIVSLHRIENLLQIYDEHIENEAEFVLKCERDGGAGYFAGRFGLLRSLLEIIQFHTQNTAESLQKQIDAIYAASREERQSAT